MKTGYKKHLIVACALIEQKDGRVLAAQRGEAMSMPLKWEFPGGKLHGSESAEACLVREVMEELAVKINIKARLTPVTHEYADISVTLYPFVAAISEGEITLCEHKEIRWLLPEELPSLDWAEADLPVVDEYIKLLERRS